MNVPEPNYDRMWDQHCADYMPRTPQVGSYDQWLLKRVRDREGLHCASLTRRERLALKRLERNGFVYRDMNTYYLPRCTLCGGAGVITFPRDGSIEEHCPVCNGKGYTRVCPDCEGEGCWPLVMASPHPDGKTEECCRKCNGKGVVEGPDL